MSDFQEAYLHPKTKLKNICRTKKVSSIQKENIYIGIQSKITRTCKKGRKKSYPKGGKSIKTDPEILVEFSLFCFVQSPSHVWLFATPRTTAYKASRSLTISWSLSKFMFIALVMPSSHLILLHPLILLLSIFPSIRSFSSESSVHIRWPKY